MSGKIFDLTPESVPNTLARRPASARRSGAWDAEAVRVERQRVLRREAMGAAMVAEQDGDGCAAPIPSFLHRNVGPEEWAAAVRRATEDREYARVWLARRHAEQDAAAAMLQAQAEVGREGGALSPALSGRIQAKRGGGQPLEATVRRGMEGVFQVNFGHVRIHADPEADALNQGVAAIAFTVGADIFFRAGAYQPHSAAGQHLLAHELTHVVQQRTSSLGSSGGGGNAGGTMTVGAADDRHEQEAEATAHRVTAALQRRALLSQAATPGAGLARRHDPTMTLTPAAQGVRRAPLPGTDPPVFPVSFPAIVYYPGGANIHTHPAVGSPVVALLPSLTTKVVVIGKTTTSNQAGGTPDWYEVRVSAGPHAGKVGFLQSFRIDSRWPTGDPDPTLYVIQPGDTALGLAARFYGLAGSAHPETNADLRRYVEVLVRVNQRNAYWIEHGNDGDPLNWMRAQVRATYAMWVPSRAWAGTAAGAVPNPSLTGGAWAAVHQQLQAHGWGEVNILQAVSLFAQDVAVVGDRAVGALRHAIVVSGTLLGEVTAETARAVLPVLQDLASAAVAPAVLMARLGALAARKLADVPAALLTLLERKAHELLASLLGAPVLARLGGAVQAILKDPGTFIGNLVAALNAGVGHLIDHVAHHFGEDALGWLIGKLGAGIPIPRSLALADLLPTVQDLLGLTRAHLRDLVVQRIVRTQRISAQQAGQLVDKAGNLVARLDSLAHKAWGALTGGQAPRLVQQLVDGVRDGLRDWLWGQMITLGLKVLVELSTPLVGEVIALIQAVYAAVQTFLQYEGTLKEVFGTIVGTFADLAEHKDAATATRIGQGVIGPTLVRLIVPALDFLAGLFGIGKIADGVQKALQAVRSKVEKALTPLIAALADAVRGVAGAKPTPRQSQGHPGESASDYPSLAFEVDGDHHRLWVEPGPVHPQIMIAIDSQIMFQTNSLRGERQCRLEIPILYLKRYSIPTPIETFLQAARNSSFTNRPGKVVNVARADGVVAEMKVTIGEIRLLRRQGKDTQGVKARLTTQQAQLAMLLKRVLSGVDANIFQDNEKYMLEGFVAEYSKMPMMNRDDMTPDHQPQAEMLKHVAELTVLGAHGTVQLFAGRAIVRVVRGSHVDGGLAINLHENRHFAGRTYGRVPNRALVDAAVAAHPHDPDAQRATAIDVLKSELAADVAQMRQVAHRPNSDPIWGDIQGQTRDDVINAVRSQILNGEKEMAAQKLDRLKDP